MTSLICLGKRRKVRGLSENQGSHPSLASSCFSASYGHTIGERFVCMHKLAICPYGQTSGNRGCLRTFSCRKCRPIKYWVVEGISLKAADICIPYSEVSARERGKISTPVPHRTYNIPWVCCGRACFRGSTPTTLYRWCRFVCMRAYME